MDQTNSVDNFLSQLMQQAPPEVHVLTSLLKNGLISSFLNQGSNQSTSSDAPTNTATDSKQDQKKPTDNDYGNNHYEDLGSYLSSALKQDAWSQVRPTTLGSLCSYSNATTSFK